MIKHKDYIEIENHVTEINIRGWENYKNFKYQNSKVNYSGVADGKKYNVTSEGSWLIKDIVNKICKQVKK